MVQKGIINHYINTTYINHIISHYQNLKQSILEVFRY